METADRARELTWNAENVRLLMFHNNISSRGALAKTLGIPRSAVNATFDENWFGRATARVIARLARYFGVPMSQVVVEPAVANGKQRTDTPEFEQGVAMTNGQNVNASGGDGVLMVTRNEAARRLSLSVREINHARRRGDLAAQKYGSKILISVDELQRFAEALPAD